jgi:ketosteroid isomerase-like protein
MPSESVELVRSILSDWGRGDYSSAQWADPEIEFVIADGPSRGQWQGLAGMAEGWRAALSAWDDHRTRAEEFREIDEERVLVLVRGSGRGKVSGLEVGQAWVKAATLFHVRGGSVTRVVVYLDRHRALAALGLAAEIE